MRPYLVLAALLVGMGAGGLADIATAQRNRDVSVSGSNRDERVPCEDGRVSVSGSNNRVEIVGHCAELRVSGSNNRVFADMLPRSLIDVSGSNNRIDYRLVERGPEPLVRESGSNNIISRR